MKVRKLAVFVVLLVLAAALMVACGGQEKSTSNTGSSTTASSNAASSATASGAASTFDGLEEKEVRVATTEKDYQILKGASEIGKIIRDGKEIIKTGSGIDTTEAEGGQKVIQMGNRLVSSDTEVNPEYGYYEKDNLSNISKTLYYPISGLPVFEGYGKLIGTYGDVPVLEINKNIDAVVAFKNQGLTAYKCKLVGCSIGWINSENAIWNQNDLLPVANPASLEITDLNGQTRSTPMDWEFGEELLVNCNGNSHQAKADCYVYAIDDKPIELAVETIKISRNGRTGQILIYDISKLEPGLYYFQDAGIYKIV